MLEVVTASAEITLIALQYAKLCDIGKVQTMLVEATLNIA